jgi:hypothetical protein
MRMCSVHQYVCDIHRQRDNERKNQTMRLKRAREKEGRERGLLHTLRKERRGAEHKFGSERNARTAW